MIYICTQIPVWTPLLEETLLACVPKAHRQRIGQYRKAEDRMRSLLCWQLLAFGWRQEFAAGLPEIFRAESGKLYVEETGQAEKRYFNFSHCKTGVCCAIGRQEMGVDIQEARQISLAMEKRCCSPAEQNWLETCPVKPIGFALLWSRKEAMGKLDGRGICMDLQQLGWLEDGPQSLPGADKLQSCQAAPIGQEVLRNGSGEVSFRKSSARENVTICEDEKGFDTICGQRPASESVKAYGYRRDYTAICRQASAVGNVQTYGTGCAAIYRADTDLESAQIYGRSWYITEDTALAVCYRGMEQEEMEQLVPVVWDDAGSGGVRNL